jgi:hypothetical protein
MGAFTIQIMIGAKGVESVRVYGQSWDQTGRAYELLSRLGPLIEKLDSEARVGSGLCTIPLEKRGIQ